MTQKIRCQICKNNQEISNTILDSIECNDCGTTLQLSAAFFDLEIPTFAVGEIVKLSHKQHIWHKELAIIRAKKHKFYRIELLNTLIWVPEEWVEKNESDSVD